MKRRPMRELLDEDCTPAEVADSLLDLRWLNRWFGGVSTTRRLFKTATDVAGQTHFTALEIASGDGYVARTITHELSASGITLDITLMDRAVSHFPPNGSMPKIAGDALSLPFRDRSFDLAFCSLFLHHLPPQPAVEFLRDALRVCRLAVLIHDLARHPLHLALAYAGVPLYRSRLTRNDAPASVWQAYTVPEVVGFCHHAGAADVHIHQQFLYRMGIIARRAQ